MHSELLCHALHTVFGEALESQVLTPSFFESQRVLAELKPLGPPDYSILRGLQDVFLKSDE